MKPALFAMILLLYLSGDSPVEKYEWKYSRDDLCRFNGAYDEPIYKPCKRYERELGYDEISGKSMQEYGYMWRSGSRIIHFIPRIGMAEISTFSIGDLYDNEYNGGKKIENSVFYTIDRDNIMIGVPGDGYEFKAHVAE